MAQIYWVQKNKRKKNIFCLLNLAVLNLNRIFVNLRLQRSSAILESDVWCFSFPILEGAMVNYWLYFRFVKDEQLLLSIKARVLLGSDYIGSSVHMDILSFHAVGMWSQGQPHSSSARVWTWSQDNSQAWPDCWVPFYVFQSS